MEKDKIFFAEDGLTTTSANYYANLAKENYTLVEQELNSVHFYKEEVSLLSGTTTNTLSNGIDTTKGIEEKLDYIARYKSFIAWMREAIKSKERLIQEAQKLDVYDIAPVLGITIPKKPLRKDVPSEDDIIATFNIKQRNRVYYLQTVCAEIGKYIHPTGAFADARKALQEVINHPSKLSGTGRDAILTTYTPSIGIAEVDNTFFELQNKQREYQAELNTIKHQIQMTIDEANRDADEKYSNEMNEYKNEMSLIDAKVSKYRNEQVRKAQALKIVVPEVFNDIFENLKKIGKKK